jgi:hypothetical protein
MELLLRRFCSEAMILIYYWYLSSIMRYRSVDPLASL